MKSKHDIASHFENHPFFMPRSFALSVLLWFSVGVILMPLLSNTLEVSLDPALWKVSVLGLLLLILSMFFRLPLGIAALYGQYLGGLLMGCGFHGILLFLAQVRKYPLSETALNWTEFSVAVLLLGISSFIYPRVFEKEAKKVAKMARDVADKMPE